MKNFMECYSKMYENRMKTFLFKLIDEKIPCAFFASPDKDFSSSFDQILNLHSQGFDIQYYFAASPPPRTLPAKFVEIEKFEQVFPRPKYVLVDGDSLACIFADRFKEASMEIIDLAHFYAPNYDIYVRHMSEIFDVYNSLVDEESRRVFLAFMLGNVSGRITDFIFDPMPQYFLEGFMPRAGDILIDGGAYDGGSSAMFKKYGCEVYAFELDSNNFPTAYERGKNEGFTVENFGLGEYSYEINYVSNTTSSHVDSRGDLTAKIVSLDEYVDLKNLPRVDFIKLDIEGSELDMLKGAALSIARWKPRLALSAYHKPRDIFTLYQLLKKIRPDYEFAFRHYAMRMGSNGESPLYGAQGQEFLRKNRIFKVPYVAEAVLYAR